MQKPIMTCLASEWFSAIRYKTEGDRHPSLFPHPSSPLPGLRGTDHPGLGNESQWEVILSDRAIRCHPARPGIRGHSVEPSAPQ